MAAVLDARGLHCPVPVLRARDRLGPLAPGAILEILADDPGTLDDIPNLCSVAGHELLEVVVLADRGGWRFRVRRGASG